MAERKQLDEYPANIVQCASANQSPISNSLNFHPTHNHVIHWMNPHSIFSMPPPSSGNPRISPLLSAVTWLEVAVLVVAGGGLLIALPLVVGIWPWSLAPFNLRFLGALYTAALLAAFLQSWFGKWAPARTVTTMIFVFTLVVTACSFLHFGRFDPALVEVWVWFVLYIGVCLNAGAHLW